MSMASKKRKTWKCDVEGSSALTLHPLLTTQLAGVPPYQLIISSGCGRNRGRQPQGYWKSRPWPAVSEEGNWVGVSSTYSRCAHR